MKVYGVFKRGFDMAASGLLLILLFPVGLLIALCIRCGDGPPVFFRQKRAGRSGKPFTLFKSRTMAGTAGGPDAHATDRVTRPGAFLRRYGLDELPQLLNIFRGDMSFVGPRPLLCEYLPYYTPEQARRHAVRPGLTGLAQVSGRNDTTWEDRLRHDVRYVDTLGFRTDLEILLRTVRCVLARKGVNRTRNQTMPPFAGTRDASLLILGAGGHGRVVAEAAAACGKFRRIAFLDDGVSGGRVQEYEVLGGFADIEKRTEQFGNAAVALGNNALRLRLMDRLKAAGYALPVIVHPHAYVSEHASIEEGTVVLSGAAVSTGSRFGRGCILNTLSSVDHDCVLLDGVHICPGAHLAGTVRVGRCARVYTAAGVGNNVAIGEGSDIGAGAAVVKDIPAHVLAAGVPARVKKEYGETP